jgi:hypothetical protein
VLGWTVRAVVFLAPVVASLITAWALTDATPYPPSVSGAVARWLLIAAVSTIVLVVVERSARRLAPIATLLDLSLLFPDRAPSRFRIALRTGTTHQLQRRIAEAQAGRDSETPAAAAQRVLELVAALRMHDHITRGHSERVRAYTQMIADEMKLDADELDRLRWAGLLHDVGKLLVPTSILNKKGRLTAEEYEIIKSHPENGRRMIEALVPWLGESARAVWEHHERWDGGGYPRGLAGEEISLAARIVSVADCYDVMTSSRSYKEPVSPREARIELARCAGTQFDPAVVRAFLNVSIGRVRRAAGPVAWIAQLPLFPTAVLGANSAGSAVVLSGAIGMSSAVIGPAIVADTFAAMSPRPFVSEVTNGWILSDDTDGAASALALPRVVVDGGLASAGPGRTTTTTHPVVSTTTTTVVIVAPPNAPIHVDPGSAAVVTTLAVATTVEGASTTSSVPAPTISTVVSSTSSTAPATTTASTPATTLAPATNTLPPATVTTLPPATTVATTVAPVTTVAPTLPQTTLPQTTLPQTTTPQVTAPRVVPTQPPQAGGPSTTVAAGGGNPNG